MKKCKNKQAQRIREESIHFRLCHLCMNLNEAAGEIHRCGKCGHDYHSISDYLMSDEVEFNLAGEEADAEMIDEVTAQERMRARFGKRLNGLVAVL